MTFGDRAFPVKLDGQPIGELLTGTYAYVDLPPGPHQLTAEFCLNLFLTSKAVVLL